MTLQLAGPDRRGPDGPTREPDSAALVLLSGTGQLLFSSRWDGARTLEQALAAGGLSGR